jgi:hypothetical protein
MALTVLSLNSENDILAGTSVYYYVHSLTCTLLSDESEQEEEGSELASSKFNLTNAKYVHGQLPNLSF